MVVVAQTSSTATLGVSRVASMTSSDILQVQRGDQDGIGVLHLRGDLDISTAGLVPESVVAMLRDGHKQIVADLRDVQLIDSVGVRALLHVRRRMWRNQGAVVFVCSEETTGRALRVMGLYDVLECTDDFDAAIASLSPPAAPGPPAA
jgi:anti-sigma B factor antagonist